MPSQIGKPNDKQLEEIARLEHAILLGGKGQDVGLYAEACLRVCLAVWRAADCTHAQVAKILQGHADHYFDKGN